MLLLKLSQPLGLHWTLCVEFMAAIWVFSGSYRRGLILTIQIVHKKIIDDQCIFDVFLCSSKVFWLKGGTDQCIFMYIFACLHKNRFKLDNLLRSIKVSDENSYVTPAFQYFNNLVQLWTFLRSDAQFKSMSSTFNPFWHNLLFSMHLLIFFQC